MEERDRLHQRSHTSLDREGQLGQVRATEERAAEYPEGTLSGVWSALDVASVKPKKEREVCDRVKHEILIP